MSHSLMSPPAVAGTGTPPPSRSAAWGKSFPPIGGLFSRDSVRALHGVDLSIGRGEIVALVGGVRFRQEHLGPLRREARKAEHRRNPD